MVLLYLFFTGSVEEAIGARVIPFALSVSATSLPVLIRLAERLPKTVVLIIG